jgi:hypothetical protein
MFRFNGVLFERIVGVGGQRLPSNNVLKVCAAQAGGLWIDYRLGRASFISRGIGTWLDRLRSPRARDPSS